MPRPPGRVAVVPSETEPGCFAWVVRAADGRCAARSPYAFATREAARLAGACWERANAGGPGIADRLRVLVADDNAFYAEALRCLLERERHEVVGVVDHAAEALAVARTRRPGLALVDLTLRDGCTGPELGRRLARAGVGVLFLTATPALAPSGEPGLLGVLPKPAGDARLLRAVAEARERVGRGRA